MTSLFQLMACRLLGTKPLSKPVPTYRQLYPWGQIEIWIKITIFVQENDFWNVVYKISVIFPGLYGLALWYYWFGYSIWVNIGSGIGLLHDDIKPLPEPMLTSHHWSPVTFTWFRATSRRVSKLPWWRHQMETFSVLLAICAGNSPVTGEFPAQRPVTRCFDVFFDLRPNKWISNREAGDLRHHRAHYDVTVIYSV